MASHQGDPNKEYAAARFSAGALDLSHLGLLRATGPDRVRYLHSMVSNDIKNLRAGEGCYATLLTNQGHMESDLYVYATDATLWMECPSRGKDRVLASLMKYLVSDVVDLEDCSGKFGILSIQGPQAQEKMQQFLGAELRLNQLQHTTVPGNRVVVHRDRTGCDGYDLWLPRNELRDVWTCWIQAQGLQPIGEEAFNWLRTEAGIPLFGVDMDNRNLPLEFGLNKAISLNKGCYRGQEIMARITYRGHLNRGFGGIRLRSAGMPQHGTAVMSGGAKIGEISSAAFSPKFQAPLALAVLKSDFLAPGTSVELALEEGMVPGEVVALPVV